MCVKNMRAMRLITVGLIILLILIQYPLWWGYGGWLHVHALRQQLADQQRRNGELKHRNERLAAEVKNLHPGSGSAAIEERARYELGMVKNGEIFVQFVSPNAEAAGSPINNASQSLMRKRGRVFNAPARIVPEPAPRAIRPSNRYHHGQDKP